MLSLLLSYFRKLSIRGHGAISEIIKMEEKALVSKPKNGCVCLKSGWENDMIGTSFSHYGNKTLLGLGRELVISIDINFIMCKSPKGSFHLHRLYPLSPKA